MLVVKHWTSKETYEYKNFVGQPTIRPKYAYKGWFLFGIIPLFIVRTFN